MSTSNTHALQTFFSSSEFAVAGASSDPSKFGHKVFLWYLTHSLPVHPLNPRSPSITAASTTHATLPSPSALPHPKRTSLSVITPPKITLPLLQEAKAAGIPAVWLQPGTFDEEVEAYARENFEAVLAGDGGGGGEGWCVLVDGEEGLKAAKKVKGRI